QHGRQRLFVRFDHRHARPPPTDGAPAPSSRHYHRAAFSHKTKTAAACRMTAMNMDERAIARRMPRKQSLQGYVLADANYDSNELHGLRDRLGGRQLAAPRRYGPKRGWGVASRRRDDCGRRSCWRTDSTRSA
ncbi:MAG: hypothetical protein ACRC1K_17550, partial [Planctomycetia bacterium]